MAARVRKPKPTLDSIFFVTPEQKLMKFLVTEPTTSFTPRVLASKLKGVRGLGGAEGLIKILGEMEEVGVVQFIDNRRAVCLNNDHVAIKLLKTYSAVCDLEGVSTLAMPISSKGVLFGSRANGRSTSDSNYDLFVVTDQCDEIKRIIESHPLGKQVEVTCMTATEYSDLAKKNSDLYDKLEKGILLWGSSW